LLKEDGGVPLGELVRHSSTRVLDLLAAVRGEGVEYDGAIAKELVSAVLECDDTCYAMGVRGVGRESIFCLLEEKVIGALGDGVSGNLWSSEKGAHKEYDLPVVFG
jgi:hypothetical protein